MNSIRVHGGESLILSRAEYDILISLAGHKLWNDILTKQISQEWDIYGPRFTFKHEDFEQIYNEVKKIMHEHAREKKYSA